MDQSGLLDLMQTYIQDQKPELVLDNFDQIPVRDVLIDSLDITEFLMALEDQLGLELEAIDLDQLGPKLAQSPTFSELADEVLRYLENPDRSR